MARQYSQQRREQDQQLRDTAQAVLDDPQQQAAMDAALSSASDRIRDYSDRNRALLYSQAQERGITLTDVGTYRQWSEAGRQVRKGERALRIAAPKGTEQRDAESTAESDQQQQEQEQEQDEVKRRFRMIAVFDRSQTDEVEQSDDSGINYQDRSAAFAGMDMGVA